jgi:hypothetical protein
MRAGIALAVLLGASLSGCSSLERAAWEACDSSKPELLQSAIPDLVVLLSRESGVPEAQVLASIAGGHVVFDLQIVGPCGGEFLILSPRHGPPGESRVFGLTPDGAVFCERVRPIERLYGAGESAGLPFCGPAPPALDLDREPESGGR